MKQLSEIKNDYASLLHFERKVREAEAALQSKSDELCDKYQFPSTSPNHVKENLKNLLVKVEFNDV